MKRRNLHSDENLYRVLFESVHDGIYRSTPEGRILAANPALVQMLGYDSEEELKKLNIGKDLYVNPDARNNFLDVIEQKGMLKDTELTLRRKDGTNIIVLENSHAVKNDMGELLFYEGTLTEITERKKAEIALRESENRYHTLIETLHDGISLFDFRGNLIYFNRMKKEMLGYSSDSELMKVNVFEMIHPDDRKIAQRLFKELTAKGSFSRREMRVLRKNGSWFHAEFSASIVKDSKGNPVYVMDSMRNIHEQKKSEEHLILLKHSVDSHYDGAYWMDSRSRFIYVNDAACRDTGYPREELIGMHAGDLIPQSTDDTERLIWKKLRNDGSFTMETIHRRKDGTTYPVEVVTTYIRFGGEEYACGFARDITYRKKSAEEMKLRLEQLRQIIDLVPSYIFAKDIDGKFILANKALADIFGLPPEEIQGKSDSDYGATREQVNWYRKYDREVIKKGIPAYIPEEQVLRKDGTLGWFQTVKIPYKHPGYSKPAILGVATEITERKQAEDELRKSEKRFRKLFEQHSAVKLIIDPEDGSIIDANRAASEFYGWPSARLKKMSIYDLNALGKEIVESRMEKVLKNNSIHFETTHRLADGSPREVEVFSSRIEIDGNIYLHSIIHDITEKKRILADLISAKEKAEESDRLKTAFLHNISHEIRTPMNAIVGFTSLLESYGLPEDAKKQYIDIIIQSSHQLLSIITDIVDISNIETGHVRITPSWFNLNAVFRNIREQYRVRTEVQGLNLKCHLPLADEKADIRADETKLVQVVSNLLDNAVKFTGSGNIDFGYKIKGRNIEFFVRDTGIGIDQKFLEKIFERFYQVESSLDSKTEGTGLGLSICKGYVELMGGEIHAESSPGRGSAFIFTIPCSRKRNSISRSSSPGKKGKREIPQGRTIVVAEDDDISFRLIRELLSHYKIKIIRAVNGREAVDLLKKSGETADLILLDLKMPVMDGFRAVREIRQFNPSIPAIALTAYVNDADRENALRSGFNGYLSKPIMKNQLLEVLGIHLAAGRKKHPGMQI